MTETSAVSGERVAQADPAASKSPAGAPPADTPTVKPGNWEDTFKENTRLLADTIKADLKQLDTALAAGDRESDKDKLKSDVNKFLSPDISVAKLQAYAIETAFARDVSNISLLTDVIEDAIITRESADIRAQAIIDNALNKGNDLESFTVVYNDYKNAPRDVQKTLERDVRFREILRVRADLCVSYTREKSTSPVWLERLVDIGKRSRSTAWFQNFVVTMEVFYSDNNKDNSFTMMFLAVVVEQYEKTVTEMTHDVSVDKENFQREIDFLKNSIRDSKGQIPPEGDALIAKLKALMTEKK